MSLLYTVYRTTNLLNGKYYIGVHKTSTPNDSYFGSGKYLKAALKKYGKGAFSKEVLFVYASSNKAFEKEEELVELHRHNALCMNIRKGGAGGFDFINAVGKNTTNHFSKEWREKTSTRSKQLLKELTPEEYQNKMSSFRQGWRLNYLDSGRLADTNRKISAKLRGSKRSEEVKAKMSLSHKGDKNHMYGKRWVTDGKSTKRVASEFVPKLLNDGWQLGKKIWGYRQEA